MTDFDVTIRIPSGRALTLDEVRGLVENAIFAGEQEAVLDGFDLAGQPVVLAVRELCGHTWNGKRCVLDARHLGPHSHALG